MDAVTRFKLRHQLKEIESFVLKAVNNDDWEKKFIAREVIKGIDIIKETIKHGK